MFSHTRPMRLILEVVVFLGTLLHTSVVATPIPLPLPLKVADYSLGVTRSSHIYKNVTFAKLTTLQSIRSSVPSDSQEQARAIDSLADLYQYYNAASTNADLLNGLAAQASSVDNDNYTDFQQQYAAVLSDFSGNLGGFQAAFAKTSTGKGLENYDRTNDLETLLKNIVNVNKSALEDTYEAVNALPVVGPILGPIVYNIKCLLDAILDTVENLTDEIINDLQPLLAAVIGKAVTTSCASGVELVGLCI